MKLLKRLSIIICCISVSAIASAQFYCRGEVKDENGKGLSNVSIVQGSTGYRFYTGSGGGFGLLSPVEKDSLLFSVDGFEKTKVFADAKSFTEVILKRAPVKANKNTLASFITEFKLETQQPWLTGEETYASSVENGFVNATQYAQTALTLNIDRASYSNIRRFIQQKSPVPPDAVRLEEMLNYFSFQYKPPAAGKDFHIETTLTGCPWNPSNQLLFAKIDSRKLDADNLPPTHLVFLIDASASMDAQDRLPVLKAGFRRLVENLRAKDSVSIVIYGSTVGILLNTTSGSEKTRILNRIDSLEPGGSTPGESGIKLAYSLARNHFIKKGNNRIILATDGDFNVGIRSDEELEQMIREQSNSGIYLTCLGIGMRNYKDSRIQVLAEKGNGNFAYIDRYAEAEKVLMKEFMQTVYTVADDASLSVKFNPAFVKRYRTLGFDNRLGALKDTLAKIEGGEVGSAFSIVVAFEIEPQVTVNPGALYDPATFTVSYRHPRDQRNYKESTQGEIPMTPFKELPAWNRFATSVIMYGSLLKETKFIKEKEKAWTELLLMAQQAYDPADPNQKEFLSMAESAKAIYTSRKKKKPGNN